IVLQSSSPSQNSALPAAQAARACLPGLGVYLPDLRGTFFAALFPALPGGLVGPLALVLAASSGMSLLAMGDPSPVHASHPGPAANAPLLPWVMSLNAEAALAAQIAGCRSPTFVPSCWLA